jgi:hypothetical protein
MRKIPPLGMRPSIVDGLHKRNMELQKEEDIAGFLGVHIDCRPDGWIKLTQKGLTKRIIEALHVENMPVKRTPAKLGVLGSNWMEILPI